ncbi:MAG: hypothetical protein P8X89_24595, partial [Reinekea sp.]
LLQYQRFDTEPEALQPTIQHSIDGLMDDYRRIDKSLKKFADDYTLFHRNQWHRTTDTIAQGSAEPNEAEQLLDHFRYLYKGNKDQQFSSQEISALIGKLGYMEAQKKLHRQNWRYRLVQNQLRAAYEKAAPYVQQSLYLDPQNPLRMISGYRFGNLIEYRTESVVEIVRRIEQETETFLGSAQKRAFLSSPILLMANDPLVDQWLEFERQKATQERLAHPNYYDLAENVKQAIAHRFYQKEWLAFWALLKKHAEFLDSYNDIEQNLKYELVHARRLERPTILHFAAHEYPGNSTNINQVPQPAIQPRFTDEQGRPYANTQILCWRYSRRTNTLGRMDIDRITGTGYTVGILYTDANGYPTLHKPDFLQKKQHEISLQVEEDTGNVLLLERSHDTKKDDTGKPISNDPLTGRWRSYTGEDNLLHLADTIHSISDNPTLNADNWQSAPLSELGFDTPGAIYHDVTEHDLSGFFELPVGYEFGFMVLPLGYGSVSIQSIHTLPEDQNGSFKVCRRVSISPDVKTISLPRTLRQSTHELIQARDQLEQTQKRLFEVNQHKLGGGQRPGDIQELELLKNWLTLSMQHPFTADSAQNLKEKNILHSQLTELQQGIKNSIYQPPLVTDFRNSSDAIEREAYNRQFLCKQAADLHQQA